MDNISRLTDAAKIYEQIQETHDLSILEDMIQDNNIEFKHKDILYRVRLLNRADKEILDELRRKKFGQLIKDEDVLLEKDLIANYKKRDVDIEDMDSQIKKLQSEQHNEQLKLGESISNKIGESVLKVHKDKIQDIKRKITILLIEKSNLLAYSFENQFQNYISEAITWLSLENLKKEEWVRVFKDFKDFRIYDDEQLIERAGMLSIKLQYNI